MSLVEWTICLVLSSCVLTVLSPCVLTQICPALMLSYRSMLAILCCLFSLNTCSCSRPWTWSATSCWSSIDSLNLGKASWRGEKNNCRRLMLDPVNKVLLNSSRRDGRSLGHSVLMVGREEYINLSNISLILLMLGSALLEFDLYGLILCIKILFSAATFSKSPCRLLALSGIRILVLWKQHRKWSKALDVLALVRSFKGRTTQNDVRRSHRIIMSLATPRLAWGQENVSTYQASEGFKNL